MPNAKRTQPRELTDGDRQNVENSISAALVDRPNTGEPGVEHQDVARVIRNDETLSTLEQSILLSCRRGLERTLQYVDCRFFRHYLINIPSVSPAEQPVLRDYHGVLYQLALLIHSLGDEGRLALPAEDQERVFAAIVMSLTRTILRRPLEGRQLGSQPVFEVLRRIYRDLANDQVGSDIPTADTPLAEFLEMIRRNGS